MNWLRGRRFGRACREPQRQHPITRHDGKSSPLCLVMIVHGDGLLPFLENALITLRASGNFLPVVIWTSQWTSVSLCERLANCYGAKCLPLILPLTHQENGYANWGTDTFKTACAYKYQALLKTLDLGYEQVVYADCDIAYLNDFSTYISDASKNFEMGVQSEAQPVFPPKYCCGFMYFTQRAKPVLEQLHSLNMDALPNRCDQTVFNDYINGDSERRTRLYVLPESLFQNGLQYRGHLSGHDKRVVGQLRPFLFHANWVVGLCDKRRLLKRLRLWKI